MTTRYDRIRCANTGYLTCAHKHRRPPTQLVYQTTQRDTDSRFIILRTDSSDKVFCYHATCDDFCAKLSGHLLSECLSIRPSVRPSVCLSVCHTRDPRLRGSRVEMRFIPYDRGCVQFLEGKFHNPRTSVLKTGTPGRQQKFVMSRKCAR